MIRKSLSNSKGFASLSPKAAVLFCMIIPHLDSHGKMNGGAGYVKDEVCPRVEYLTLELLKSLLAEISNKTSLKWFDHDGRKYIHSVNFLKKHQNLPENKIGKDKLPSYSELTPELLPYEVEVEVETKTIDRTTSDLYSDDFEAFWTAYPRKVGKGEAAKVFKAHRLGGVKLQSVLDAVEAHKKTDQWKKDSGQFIPHPTTWLKQKRYDDQVVIEFDSAQAEEDAWARRMAEKTLHG